MFKFKWDNTYKPTGSGTFAVFDTTQPFALSVVTKDGTTYTRNSTFNWVEYTQNSARINYPYIYNSTKTAELFSTEYYRSFNLDFTPISRLQGIKGMSITPFEDAMYDLGNTQGLAWNNIVGHNIIQSSSRKVKEGIETWDKSALDILAQVDIKSFYFKTDRDSKDRYRHIGFIAEDTPVELATPKQNSMDVGSCIGVLIKAVQELSAQNKALTERLKKMGGK